jgi:hypothetical protein
MSDPPLSRPQRFQHLSIPEAASLTELEGQPSQNIQASRPRQIFSRLKPFSRGKEARRAAAHPLREGMGRGPPGPQLDDGTRLGKTGIAAACMALVFTVSAC